MPRRQLLHHRLDCTLELQPRYVHRHAGFSRMHQLQWRLLHRHARSDCLHDMFYWALLPARRVGRVALPWWQLRGRGQPHTSRWLHGVPAGLIMSGWLDTARAMPSRLHRSECVDAHVPALCRLDLSELVQSDCVRSLYSWLLLPTGRGRAHSVSRRHVRQRVSALQSWGVHPCRHRLLGATRQLLAGTVSGVGLLLPGRSG